MDRTVAIFTTAVRVCLIAAPVLASVMSLTSDYNHHPDEIHHFEAARYYVDHFLPPEIGDPNVRQSYSVWGVSYLNYHWIEYFLAGKFMLVMSPVVGSELIAARLFNITLFAGLAIFFAYRSRGDQSTLLLPSLLLITPQVWYVFSYVNNDAFPLAASFIAAYQISHPQSALNRFLIGERFSDGARGAAGVGILLGLLLISKTNYYAFLIFLALWILYKFPIVRFADARPKIEFARVKRYAFIFLVAVSVLAFRCSLDLYVNGETNFVAVSYLNYIAGDFEKKESRLMEYQEKIADPPFKPSTIERDLGASFPGMRLKDKGTSFADVFIEWRWHEISFESFVGVYGYMNIYAPKIYYRVIGLMYAGFLAYMLGLVLLRRRRDEIVQSILLLIGAAITIFVSSYLSWTYAFQAQGRYVFPLLPMAAVFLYAMRDVINKALLTTFVVACFLVSVYSFLLVGVRDIDSPPSADSPVKASQTASSIVIRGQHS